MKEKDYYGAIKGFCLKWNLPEVWNSDRITGANLIYEVIKVINAMILEQKAMKEMIEEFLLMFNEDLSDTVKDQLTVWLNDGTLGDIINETLFNSKADKEDFNDFVLDYDNFILEYKNRTNKIILRSENKNVDVKELIEINENKIIIFDIDETIQLNEYVNVYGSTVLGGKFNVVGLGGFILHNNAVLDSCEIYGEYNYDNADLVSGQMLVRSIGSYDNYNRNIVVKNCIIRNAKFYGIYFDFVRDSLIHNNTVLDIGSIAIGNKSADNVDTFNNTIKRIGRPGVVIAYGIQYSVLPIVTGSISENNPISKNSNIYGNRIDGVETWEGIDTHGGENLRIYSNHITNCYDGIALTRVEYSDGSYTSKNITVSGNIIETYHRGVAVHGLVSNHSTGITITGNIIKIVSVLEDEKSSGVWLNMCEFVTVTGNTISSNDMGVAISVNVRRCTIVGNSITSKLAFIFEGISNAWNVISNNAVQSTKGLKVKYMSANNLFVDNGYISTIEGDEGVDIDRFLYKGIINKTIPLLSGDTSPVGRVGAPYGSLFILVDPDDAKGSLYIKETNTSPTGWKKVMTE